MDQQWLDSLKVGDEVCYYNRWSGYKITRIEKITPTRQIKTECGLAFKRGYHRVDAWNGYALQPATDEVRNDIRKRHIVFKLSNANWTYFQLEQLEQIYAIVTDQNQRST